METETGATLLALQRLREPGEKSGRTAVQPVVAYARLAAGRTYLRLFDDPRAVAIGENIPRGWRQSEQLRTEVEHDATAHGEPDLGRQPAINRRRVELETGVNRRDRALGKLQGGFADMKREKRQDLARQSGEDVVRATDEWDRKVKANEEEIDQALRAQEKRLRNGRP